MTEEEHKHVKKAEFYGNLAFLLGDVINTYAMDAIDELAKIERDLRFQDKHALKELCAALGVVKKKSAEFAKLIYKGKQADIACANSDYLSEVIKLIVDRTGDDDKSKRTVINAIMRVSSKMKFYDEVKKEI